MNPNLYIIGNGFDIDHDIPSRYSDFKKYLLYHNKDLCKNIETYLPVDKDWNTLEKAVGNLDAEHLHSEKGHFLVDYGNEEWSDAYHHDYQYEISQILENISKNLKDHFYNWLSGLKDFPCNAHLTLDVESLFLSFNYTNTLERIYKISPKNIVYIHGKSEYEKSKIILGHSWHPKTIPNLNDTFDPEVIDPRVSEANDLINEYFTQTFKPVKKIIKNNKYFFNNLKNISNIFVLGHSLSDVDFPYFEEIVKNTNNDVCWTVTYHTPNDLANHKNAMQYLKLDNVRFCTMNEIILKR